MNRSGIPNLPGCRQGAALVEFTVVFPLLLSLCLGVIEFGRILQHHHLLTKSMRDAARYLARTQLPNCPADTTVTIDTTTAGSPGYFALGLARTGRPPAIGDATYDALVPYWNDAGFTATAYCVDNGSGAYRGLEVLPIITAQVNLDYDDVGFLGFFGIDSLTLTASHEEFHVGE